MFPYTDNLTHNTGDGKMRETIATVLAQLANPQSFSAHFPDGRIERLTTYESAMKLITENPAVVVHVDEI